EQDERQRWERDCAPAATEEFRHDQVCANCLLQRYNYNLKRRRNYMPNKSCRAQTATGRACRAPAMEGGLCFLHANPESAKTLGQLGGQKNRRPPLVDLEIPEKMTLADLSRLNAHAMHLLVSDKLKPHAATALAQLSNAQVRVMQALELEARLKALEAQVAGAQSNARRHSQPGEA